MADSKEKLFSEFPNVSTEDWMSKITVDLKGADYIVEKIEKKEKNNNRNIRNE